MLGLADFLLPWLAKNVTNPQHTAFGFVAFCSDYLSESPATSLKSLLIFLQQFFQNIKFPLSKRRIFYPRLKPRCFFKDRFFMRKSIEPVLPVIVTHA